MTYYKLYMFNEREIILHSHLITSTTYLPELIGTIRH